MARFEPKTSGVRNDHSADCATTFPQNKYTCCFNLEGNFVFSFPQKKINVVIIITTTTTTSTIRNKNDQFFLPIIYFSIFLYSYHTYRK